VNPQLVKRIVVMGVLLIILVGVVWFQFFRGSPAPSGGTSAKAQSKAAKAASAKAKGGVAAKVQEGPKSAFEEDIDLDELLKQVREVDFDYDQARVGRNPMNPLVGVTFAKAGPSEGEGEPGGEPDFELLALAQRMKLTGIVWDPAGPVAIIDNNIVAPGAELPGGIVVESISEDQVVLGVKGSEITKELKEQ